jgi:hypothetical protein
MQNMLRPRGLLRYGRHGTTAVEALCLSQTMNRLWIGSARQLREAKWQNKPIRGKSKELNGTVITGTLITGTVITGTMINGNMNRIAMRRTPSDVKHRRSEE